MDAAEIRTTALTTRFFLAVLALLMLAGVTLPYESHGAHAVRSPVEILIDVGLNDGGMRPKLEREQRTRPATPVAPPGSEPETALALTLIDLPARLAAILLSVEGSAAVDADPEGRSTSPRAPPLSL